MTSLAPSARPALCAKPQRSLILCFDGSLFSIASDNSKGLMRLHPGIGNKFGGTPSDSKASSTGKIPTNSTTIKEHSSPLCGLLQVDGLPVAPLDVDEKLRIESFTDAVNRVATAGSVHDSLKFGGGLCWNTVLSWRLREYFPFRRIDLQDDGSWKAISWPLPRGEVRDMDRNCRVHNSVIRRIKADKNYRPGNLIVGGGGRGTIKAPKHYGMGSWKIVHEEGNVVWGGLYEGR